MIPVELAKTPELSRLKREYHIAEARYWRKAGDKSKKQLCIWLAEKEERERIYQTSIRPFRKATYTHFPEIDPRLRNYRSRYGAISND